MTCAKLIDMKIISQTVFFKLIYDKIIKHSVSVYGHTSRSVFIVRAIFSRMIPQHINHYIYKFDCLRLAKAYDNLMEYEKCRRNATQKGRIFTKQHKLPWRYLYSNNSRGFLISPVIPFIGLYSITFISVSYEPIEIVHITSLGLDNVFEFELVKFTCALLPNNITIELNVVRVLCSSCPPRVTVAPLWPPPTVQ